MTFPQYARYLRSLGANGIFVMIGDRWLTVGTENWFFCPYGMNDNAKIR